MASLECESENHELNKENKVVRRQIISTIADSRTGSMMPVVLEMMVDGTKSKRSGKKLHMPNMAGDGGNPKLLDLSMYNKGDSHSTVVGKPGKGRGQRTKKLSKVDSDLEILSELSGDSDGIKFNREEFDQINQNISKM